MHIRLGLGLVIAAVVLGGSSARAGTDEKGPRVGVVIELAVDVDADRADAFGAALADALNRELVVDAVGGEDVSRQLPAGGLPDECVGDPGCVRDVAGRIDAEQLLFLVLVQVGPDVQVDASWVDVATGQVLARPRVVLPSEARAVSVFAAQAQRYLPDAAEREDKGPTIIVNAPTRMVPPTPRRMSVATWVLAGVAVAAAGTGVGLGLSVRSSYHACEHVPGGCSDGRLDGIALRANLTDASFALAAGAAITTAILWLRSGSPGGPAPEVAPTAGGAVVGLAGRW